MNQEFTPFLRRLYWLTSLVGVIGFISYFWAAGARTAFGFLLGALASAGNLWLFQWLSRAVAPGEAPRKPWQAGAFIGRYVILFGFGYVIVNALGVSPLAVVLGLLASTAALLLSSVSELLLNFRRS